MLVGRASMDIEIVSVGLATPQGSAAEIFTGKSLQAPRELPWPLRPGTRNRLCHPARGVSDQLVGPERWQALAAAALTECLSSTLRPGTPLVIASCNGAAHSVDGSDWINAFNSRRLLGGTPWAEQSLPIVSGSCASGLHALFMAAQLLDSDFDEVMILAVDILSPASHENFDALRVLAADGATPWQSTSTGFVPGEAAVALRVKRSDGYGCSVVTSEPVLRHEIGWHDSLRDLVAEFRSRPSSIVVGQGTGPVAADALELSAIDSSIDQRIPVTTPQLHFGHSLGASGLLSLSIAALAVARGELPLALQMPPGVTSTGRPLASRRGSPCGSALVVCRALSGACAVTRVGGTRDGTLPKRAAVYRPATTADPVGHPVLRRIATEATGVRPLAHPDLLLVRADAPLLPSPRGSIGSRLLPHAVLEITPGSIPSIVARQWGYNGPALCLVGDPATAGIGKAFVRAYQSKGGTVAQCRVHGTGHERELEWDVEPR
jgi:hypothetical protein